MERQTGWTTVSTVLLGRPMHSHNVYGEGTMRGYFRQSTGIGLMTAQEVPIVDKGNATNRTQHGE